MPGNNEDNIFFIGDFDDSLEEKIIIPLTKQIQAQKKAKDGRIDLYINSFGGYAHLVEHLINLVEIAKSEGITVRTIVPSVAFSSGSMLAVTGSPGERYIGRNAEHLVHYGSIASFESTPAQLDRMRAWKERFFKSTLKHYEKYCEIPNIKEQMQDDGFFIIAKDCLKWKLADHYIDKLDIGE